MPRSPMEDVFDIGPDDFLTSDRTSTNVTVTEDEDFTEYEMPRGQSLADKIREREEHNELQLQPISKDQTVEQEYYDKIKSIYRAQVESVGKNLGTLSIKLDSVLDLVMSELEAQPNNPRTLQTLTSLIRELRETMVVTMRIAKENKEEAKKDLEELTQAENSSFDSVNGDVNISQTNNTIMLDGSSLLDILNQVNNKGAIEAEVVEE